MPKPLIIITGKDGQLGFELTQIQQQYSNQFDFLFTNRSDLDLMNEASIEAFINQHQPKYFINCAAYTAVDKAEIEKDIAFAINATAPSVIAKTCASINCQFIHISTDYVFDGEKKAPYLPSDEINPLNVYGASKATGEQLAIENNPQSIIIRTSWVYSTHGKNFVKTMLKLMSERESINVVADQIGCPTNAADLASAIMQITVKLNDNNSLKHSNIYHYSNTGNISWFQFAQAIQEIAKLNCTVNPIPSSAYPTPAQRSNYSVMDTSYVTNDFGVEIKEWRNSLQLMVNSL
ncbi:MAG: dTDP-4-dehydrorhamnose reductase [Chitinophagaceae bacterium]